MALAQIVSSSPFALIDSLGGGELLALLVMLMVVVGPDRLPEVARKIGRGIAQVRQQISAMSTEVRDVVDDPAMAPLREIGEFAMRPRQKLSEIVKLAEFDLSEETAAKQAKADREPAAEAPQTAAGEPAATPLDEPGEPPRDGPQYPLNVEDEHGDRPPPPEDVHVAATRQARKHQAAATRSADSAARDETAGDRASRDAPSNPAFRTGGTPLGSVNGTASPQEDRAGASGRELSEAANADDTDRPSAFTLAARPLSASEPGDTPT